MSTEPFPAPGEPGRTWIADQIVAKIASTAAREVEGVEDLRGGSIRRGWTRSSDRRQSGAGVRIENGQAAIDLRLVVRDGIAIPEIVERGARPGDRARAVRHRPGGLTGRTSAWST